MQQECQIASSAILSDKLSDNSDQFAVMISSNCLFRSDGLDRSVVAVPPAKSNVAVSRVGL